ncbi:NRT1/PTR family protein 2.2 [Melia azedarach]|uniref:NRT1/PTR family protein 2.2 n=1 Tax=Melia azedarach TaxID=155640 RepID=A0ACC1XK02_MELAZ|nr:NRT1/PTR family protein 2.2 [Melia azedarach]
MMAAEEKKPSSFKLYCAARCFQSPPSPPRKEENGYVSSDIDSKPAKAKKKHGGWKAIPYILGNETFERLATLGLSANFMVYLIREFHLSQSSAANVLNIWGGVTNFAPLIGAFISDAFAGRFKTIAFASFASFLGMVAVTLTAWVPELHPPKCDVTKPPFGQCKGPNKSQLAVLLTGLGLLSVGTGGVRPCGIPFGVDQFDATTEKGIKGINSFFNWYYTSFTVVIMITQTLVVYIQDSVSWVIGFGIPTILMVLVAAYKKRRLQFPDGQKNVIYYDPPSKLNTDPSKLSLTNQFRFLNKAAMIVDNELKANGTPISHWTLCSVQQVEDVKCVIKVIPIWASGIIALVAMIQQTTFTVSQAMQMDRHLGPNFQVPPGSIGVISMLTIGIWLPLYDRVLVPALRKITKIEAGIKILQRIGIGMVFAILSMVAAGLVERERRSSANAHPQSLGIAPLSVFWLAPQLILMGFSEAFFALGQIEFYNKQFPDHMKSIANSLLFCAIGCANYLSSLMITIIHGNTGKHGRPDWLTNDINAGRLDYFYYVLAGMGVVNFIYFLYCAHIYRYRGSVELEEKSYVHDVELAGPIKP